LIGETDALREDSYGAVSRAIGYGTYSARRAGVLAILRSFSGDVESAGPSAMKPRRLFVGSERRRRRGPPHALVRRFDDGVIDGSCA
jgi:hypothetical protein